MVNCKFDPVLWDESLVPRTLILLPLLLIVNSELDRLLGPQVVNDPSVAPETVFFAKSGGCVGITVTAEAAATRPAFSVIALVSL